jgi:membrane protein YqaA with SNARE-associated domain
MKAQTAKLYNWAIQKAESSKAPFWIGLLFVLEIALFIPLDAILMFFCLRNPKKTFQYVAIAALASTLSGLIGYLLGHFLWDLIGPYVVPHLIPAASFDRLSHHFQTYESWAVFFGALLPFPLKALSLAAGVFQLGIWPFFLWFLAARTVRFTLIGGAMMLWGEKVKLFVDRHFHRIFMVIGAKVAMAFLLFWAIAR